MPNSKVDEILAHFISEIPQFIAADCAELSAGSSVSAGTSVDRNVDLTLASGGYAEVIQANAGALDFLGIGSDALEDIVITTRDAFVLIRPVGAQHYVSLVITRRGNLALARQVIAKYEPALIEAFSQGE